jgi:drug/metabolite transporter (DMT)-like permease
MPKRLLNRTDGNWHWDFVALSAIWGSSFMFTQTVSQDLGPTVATFARVGIATLFLLPLLLAKGHARLLLGIWRHALFLGVFTAALPFFAYGYALQWVSTTTASIINATTPLFGAIIAWVWLSDRLDRNRTAGLALGFFGVCALILSQANGATRVHSDLLGTLICLLAPASYGLSAAYSKKFLNHVPSMVQATASQFGGTVVIAPIALWAWPSHAPATGTWGAMLMLGIVCSGIAYLLFYRIIALAGPARALTVTFAIPLFAAAYGLLLLNESLNAATIGSASVIILGITLATGLWQPMHAK